MISTRARKFSTRVSFDPEKNLILNPEPGPENPALYRALISTPKRFSAFAAARVQSIYGGTSEVMKEIIARTI